jgi:integrase
MGGTVKPFKTFSEQPARSFATAWRRAKMNADESLRIAKKRSVEQWKKAKGNSHIQRFRWHDLRHSAVSRLAASGVNDRTIQEISGWMSLKVSKHCLELSMVKICMFQRVVLGDSRLNSLKSGGQ